jgi:zinc transport system substrate-binding protein
MIRPLVMLLLGFAVFLALPAAAAPLQVFVSIAPQKFIVERIAGPHAEVHQLVDRGQDPHFFEPTPRQLAQLGKAAIYFTIGLGFEEQLVERLAQNHPDIRFLGMDKGIDKLPVTEHLGGEKKAGAENSHHAGGGDPHIWLSPLLVERMAATVSTDFSAIDPSHSAFYRINKEKLSQELKDIDLHLRELLEPYRGRVFYVFHPAFAYFASAYGLQQKAVEAGGRSPSPGMLAALISQAREEKVRIIFAQPQFDQRSAEAIAAAIGGVVVRLDSLAYDLLGNFRTIGSSLERSFRQSSYSKRNLLSKKTGIPGEMNFSS